MPLAAGAVKKHLEKSRRAARGDSASGSGSGSGSGSNHRPEGFGVEGFRDGGDWHDGRRAHGKDDRDDRDDRYDRYDRYDRGDDGDHWWIDPIFVTILVWAVLFVIAVAVAASCGAGFRDYVVVVLDPFVYLMIRLAVPCGGGPAGAGASIRGMFS